MTHGSDRARTTSHLAPDHLKLVIQAQLPTDVAQKEVQALPRHVSFPVVSDIPYHRRLSGSNAVLRLRRLRHPGSISVNGQELLAA